MQQKVVLENSGIVADSTVHHLWPVILYVLHESGLRVIHQVVLVGRRSSSILGIIKSGSCCVGVRTKIVYGQVLVNAHEAVLAVTRVVKGAVSITTD